MAVLGAAWVQTAVAGAPHLNVSWWLAASALGLQAAGILTINNLRDREQDARVAKRTLVVRLGRRGGLIYLVILHVAAAVCVAVAGYHTATVVAGMGGLGLGALAARLPAARLNPLLGLSALLELLTALAIARAA
jgi:1,4-dihydroxy-2-naphthoate octaprenyltransferase